MSIFDEGLGRDEALDQRNNQGYYKYSPGGASGGGGGGQNFDNPWGGGTFGFGANTRAGMHTAGNKWFNDPANQNRFGRRGVAGDPYSQMFNRARANFDGAYRHGRGTEQGDSLRQQLWGQMSDLNNASLW